MDILNFLSNAQNWGLVLLIIIGAVFFLYSFVIFYHFIRFGVGGRTKVLALIFFIGVCLLSAVTLIAYQKVNWLAILEAIKNALPNIKPV
ncbi:hypothetical protein COS21_03675 [bacterium (Candidatus Gribaldobacteria) CG02_land_8_20_14_3_00_41_15]|nr:MAG: hypothetical protein COS21_03675 [bacterium (Candidatus Gribaldobacteria) CG02_land_8_20_14_3_00_41_15]